MNKVYEFFLQWEVAARKGECMPLEEYKAMTPEAVAEQNAKSFEEFMASENPL